MSCVSKSDQSGIFQPPGASFYGGEQVTSTATGNIFADIPAPGGRENEDIKELLARQGLKIERIVSHGHASPPGFWFDQIQAEWVIVLAGRAKLRFEDEAEARMLIPGNYVFIPARKRHRVEWTSETEPTVWLAVNFGADRRTA